MDEQAKRNRSLGKAGEDLAQEIITDLGWQIIDRNWRCKRGEIDLVATDPTEGTLVFIEVKTRRSILKGTPAAAVDKRKQKRLRQLVSLWRDAHPDAPPLRPRIDVITLDCQENGPVQARLIRGAA